MHSLGQLLASAVESLLRVGLRRKPPQSPLPPIPASDTFLPVLAFLTQKNRILIWQTCENGIPNGLKVVLLSSLVFTKQ